MSKSRFVWVVPSVLALGIFLLLSYSGEQISVNPSYKTSVMKEMHLTHREDNALRWELFANEATFPLGGREVFLHTLSLQIQHDPLIYLTSDSAVYDVDSGNVLLNRPVEIRMRDTIFSTNSLNWNSAEETVTTNDPVTVRGENFLIEGEGLIAAFEPEKVRILKNVKATYYR